MSLLLLLRGQPPAARALTLGVARASYRAMVSWQRNATGYFAIGSSLIGGADVLAASEWATQYLGAYDDVSADLHRIGSIRRGRADDLQTIDAGVSTFELRDNLGRYNRQNPSSPLAAYLPNALRPIRLRAIGPGLLAPVVATDLVDDVVRSLRAEGDGLTADRSLGVWRATTNETPNSGGYVDATGWTAGGTNTVAPDAGQAKFGGRSLKATYADNQLLARRTATLTAAAWAYSAWLWIPASWDGGTIRLDAEFAGATGTLNVSADMSKRDQWQRISATFTPNAGTLTATFSFYFVPGGSPPTVGRSFYFSGFQTELGTYPTPVVSTYGLARSRAVGALSFASSGIISQVSGWAAFLFRPGWASTTGAGGQRVIDWSGGGANWLGIFWDAGTSRFELVRGASIVAADTFAFAAGDLVSVVISWGPGSLLISAHKVGAAAPPVRAVANATTAMTLPATFQIGSTGSAFALDGDLLYVAVGSYAAKGPDHPLLRLVAELQADASRIPAALGAALVLDGTTSYAVTPAVTSELYSGFERTLEHSPRGRKAYAQIEAVDLFVWLSKLKPTIAEKRLLTVGAAIGYVLDAIGWSDVSLRELDVGDEIPLFSATGEATGLELIEELLQIDRGLFYISKAGIATYRSRVTRAARRPKAAIVNEMTKLGPGVSVDTVVNRATVTKAPDGIPQTYQDDESAHFNGPIDAPSLESRYLRDDAHAASVARAIVEDGRRGHAPLWGLELDNRSSLLLAIALSVEIGDRVTVAAVSGSSSPADYFVEQIEAAVEQPSGRHTCRLVLSEAGPIPFVIGTDAVGGPAPIF